MGADNSTFAGCAWSEARQHGLWTIQHGKLETGKEVSLFTPAKGDKKSENLLRKLTKQLRVVRHPCILQYLGSHEDVDTPQLFTEKAEPLENVLSSLQPMEICAGLYNIMQALNFLHEKAKMSHNNLHVGSVFVSEDGSWRLGDMGYATRFAETTMTALSATRDYRHPDTVTPEERSGKVVPELDYGHARDVYTFAVMVEKLIDQLADLGDLTKTFELRITDECLNDDPRKRPKMESLLNDRLFRLDLLDISSFLDNVALKSADERKAFFRELTGRLLLLPEEVVAHRLVPRLLSRFVLLDPSAVEHVLPSLLTPCTDGSRPSTAQPGEVTPLFTEVVYRQHVVPRLVRIFTVLDFHVHKLLLTYFPCYVHLVDREDLEMEILPHALLGLRDTSDEIASLSLHALAHMVPILGRDVVVGGRAKTFFRTGLPKGENGSPVASNNRHTSVSGVMPHMRLVELTSPCPGSDSQPVTGGKAHTKPMAVVDSWKEEEKKRERDQRREEMRRQREERRLAREHARAMKLEEEKAQTSEIITNPSPGDLATTTNQTSDEHQLQESDGSNDMRKYKSDSLNGNVQNDSTRSDRKLNSDLDQGQDKGQGHSESEWSDTEDHWSDFGDDNVDTTQAISDEIEQELAKMRVTDNSGVSSHVADSVEPNIHSVNEDYVNKGKALKLSTRRDSNDSNSGKNKNSSALVGDSGVSDRVIQNRGLNMKQASPRGKPTPAATKKSGDILGAEFDIKSLDIKAAPKGEDPFDFFADMAPKIEPKNVDMFSDKTPDGSTQQQPQPSRPDFGVVTSEEVEEGAGWGEEEDW